MENDKIAKRVYIGDLLIVVQLVGRDGLLEEKRFGCQTSKVNDA